MFDDINLLPDDLRDVEEKERAKLEKSRQSAGSDFSYSQPIKQEGKSVDFKNLDKGEKIKDWQEAIETKKEKMTEESQNKQSFFQRLFGQKNKKPENQTIKAPANNQPAVPINLPKTEPAKPLPVIMAEKKLGVAGQPISQEDNKPKDKPISQNVPPKKPAKTAKHPLKKFFDFFKPQPKPKEIAIGKPKPVEKKIHLTNGDKLNSPSDSLEVNLVPAENNLLPPAKIFSFILLAVIANIIIIGISYGLIFLKNYQTQLKTQAQDQKIEEMILAINELKANEAKAAVLLEEMNQVENIINKHIYWTNFFQALEKYTLNDVYYSNLAATKEGLITLSATTVDFQGVAKQLLTFQGAADFVSQVEILGATKTGTEENPSVEFNIGLTLNPSIFLKPLN